ncbi:MAG: Xaa-Pro peptidase family protein [Candidatus Dormiibacterota bacterium]
MAFLSTDVFRHRQEALGELMREHDLDAIAIATPDNFLFFTNYFLDVAPWERPVLAVYPRSGAPFAVMHELSTNGIRMARERGTLWLDDVTLYGEHPRLSGRLPLLPQWPALVAGLLREHGLRRGSIGTDAASAGLVQAVEGLGGGRLVPMEKDLRPLRWVKTSEEQVLLRQAAALSDWGQERYRENLRVGRQVQELDFFTASQLAEEAGSRVPGEHVECRVMSVRGPDSAAPHGTGAPTGARIQAGDGIVNIIIVRLNGLVVENERTWLFGAPSPTQEEAFEVARRAQEAAIGQMVAGNPVFSIDAAALEVIERAGYGDRVVHRTGHGVGTAGHEFPDDTAFNDRALLAGEVFSAEPGVYVYGLGGFRHDDTVIVGADAPELLTRAPKDLARQTIAVGAPSLR